MRAKGPRQPNGRGRLAEVRAGRRCAGSPAAPPSTGAWGSLRPQSRTQTGPINNNNSTSNSNNNNNNGNSNNSNGNNASSSFARTPLPDDEPDDAPPLRYRTDLDKHVIHFAFQRFPHSIEIVDDDDVIAGEWHFFWMNVGRVRTVFSSSEYRLTDSQIINHFPNHYELTRKDLMYKNIKKYIRDPMNAQLTMPHFPPGPFEDGAGAAPQCLRFADCVPITYNIPNDLRMFVEEFKRQPGCTWIVKPTARSQGRGIFLVNRISQLKKWLKVKKDADDAEGPPSGFVVSKYVAKPLLIGGKKFDLRLYVLVTSFKPLVAYLHEQGFARFCATRYVADALTDENLCSHLTNVALQKGEDAYNEAHGGKWTLANLWLFVQGRYGAACADGLMRGIEFVIYHSLRAMEAAMFNDKHCFELYGYDVLIDEGLRPHLIEVNASPSLSTTTVSDRLLKEEVLEDVLKIVFPPHFPSPRAMSYWDYRLRTDLTAAVPTGFRLIQVE